MEFEGGLEVRLLKDWEHAARVWDLKLGVEVNLTVNWIDKAMQTLTGF